jgi:hypothetical protein
MLTDVTMVSCVYKFRGVSFSALIKMLFKKIRESICGRRNKIEIENSFKKFLIFLVNSIYFILFIYF